MGEPEAIGYVVALPPESGTLIPQRAQPGDILQLDQCHWVAVSGAGPQNAAAAAERLLARGVRRLVSWGCAGALADDLDSGQLVIPATLVYADGTTTNLASAWHERLVRVVQPVRSVRTERMAESPNLIASADAKRELHATTGAIATDMETGAVARAAQRHGIPCMAVRSIVDVSSVTIPSAAQAALDSEGGIVVWRMLAQLAKKPQEIPALLQLARAFRIAMRSLSDLAAHTGPGLDPR